MRRRAITLFSCAARRRCTTTRSRELAALGLPRRRIRRELSGDYIVDKPSEKSYKLTLTVQGERRELECRKNESLEWAIERAGVKAPTHCRSGECGWCHARLVSGEVYSAPRRRTAEGART